MIKFVTILGHSFVSRLERYIRHNAAEHNLALTLGMPNDVEVSFFGTGGRTTEKLMKYDLPEITLIPDIVILEIGTNDLADPDISPHALAQEIRNIIHYLKTEGVRKIVVCQILPRKTIPSRTPTFNKKVFQANKIIKTQLKEHLHAIFWEHRTLHKPYDQIFGADGIHLNNTGQTNLYQSYHNAILKAISIIDRM